MDLLGYLVENGVLTFRSEGGVVCFEALTENEERRTTWFVSNGKRWYNVDS